MKKFILAIVVLLLFFVTACYFLKAHFFPSTYRDLVEAHAVQEGLDASLLAALIYRESKFHARVISSTGDIGLMQIQPSTINELVRLKLLSHSEYNKEDLFIPQNNIRIGTLYLHALLNRIYSTKERIFKIDTWFGGSPSKVLLHSYNAGPTFVLQNCLDKCATKQEYEMLLQNKRPSTVKYAKDVLNIQTLLKVANVGVLNE